MTARWEYALAMLSKQRTGKEERDTLHIVHLDCLLALLLRFARLRAYIKDPKLSDLRDCNRPHPEGDVRGTKETLRSDHGETAFTDPMHPHSHRVVVPK